MAEIIQEEKGGGKKKAKKLSTHIDMTPMVDLACLLITFFMLTTAFSKPKAMEIVLPEKNNKDIKDAPQVDKKRTLNILLSESNRVYWYMGAASEKDVPVLVKTDFSKDGIRKLLLDKNKDVFNKIEQLKLDVISGKHSITNDSLAKVIKKLKNDDKIGPVVLIKADDKVKYRNIVDLVDEMAITNIARYAIIDLNPYEVKLLATAPK